VTFKWGRTPELWDFEFIPPSMFKDEPRPAQYAGQRLKTAFQVERAIYDEILLRHAESLDCVVREQTGVEKVLVAGDRVEGLVLPDGSTISARYYIDASGHPAIVRRALGIPIDCPTALKNIAIWDYWENAAWAAEIGIGGTRVQVMSVGYGWLWFIPLGPTRTSIGLVCPAEYYKNCKKTPRDLYHESIQLDDRILTLTANATCTGTVRTTNDWSFISDRTVGENWFLVGESAGFADPILSAGMTLTHVGAREAAYTIIALIQEQHDPAWLKEHFDGNGRRRVRQHMQFADFWYAANSQFVDMQEHCQKIAAEAGLSLSGEKAWAWLAQGGFTNDVVGQAVIGGFDFGSVKQVAQMFLDEDIPWCVNEFNCFHLHLEGASRGFMPIYSGGAIKAIDCYFRDNKRLPIAGLYELIIKVLEVAVDIGSIIEHVQAVIRKQLPPSQHDTALRTALYVLEVFVNEGWVTGSFDARFARLNLSSPREGALLHKNRDEIKARGPVS
jgi:flavin-dependent dehydrogenase